MLINVYHKCEQFHDHVHRTSTHECNRFVIQFILSISPYRILRVIGIDRCLIIMGSSIPGIQTQVYIL